jgi:branched-chain amino acid aminotransferase
MSGAIAWIGGQWGSPQELSIGLDDRGLLLADGVFTTLLVLRGEPQLLSAHHQRWQRSAALLGMAPPPAAAELAPLIQEAVQRAGLQQHSGALRLNWSRGSGSGRGIDLPATSQAHRFWLQLNPHTPSFRAVTAIVSRREQRNAHSLLSQCKTFAYGQAIQARREAQAAGADEALLLNSDGELCCGAAANVLVLRHGTWLTPPLSSGCLPGVMRGRLLELALAEEAVLTPTPEPGDQWLLINSLSCRAIRMLDGRKLEPHQGAEALWWGVLQLSCNPAQRCDR